MSETQKITISSVLLAMAVLLPLVAHSIFSPVLAQALLPMHIPVLLAGFIVGKRYGLAVGVLAPIISIIFSGYTPFKIAMIFELGAYGFASAFFFEIFKEKFENFYLSILATLIVSMLVGRIEFLIASVILFNFMELIPLHVDLSWWLSGVFFSCIIGIIIQIIIIPPAVVAVNKSNLL